jgi:hypothetical protein
MKSRIRLLFSDLSEILKAMLADAGLACSTSTCRDFVTLKSRTENEGISFLTICLPTFAKGFERSLEAGRWLPELFTGFKASKGSCLPAFLQGFTSLVFDSSKGLQHETPSIDAIIAVRQICLAFNKVEMECTEQRQRSAAGAYASCEAEVSKFRANQWKLKENFQNASKWLYGRVFHHLSDVIRSDGGLPTRHGPGTTVDGTSGNRKYLHRQWSRRLDRVLPFDRYWFFSFDELERSLGIGGILDFKVVLPKEEPPVKVCFVPKTQKAPRVIAIEPVYNQYVQQGLMRVLVPAIERDKRLKGQINFTDQSINGALALSSSITREFATIDLKDASDRLSAAVVHLMVQSFPDLTRVVFACRSKYAKLPNGKIIPMKKFASQGSALTFPLEAMAFYSIAIASFMERYGLPIHHPRVVGFCKKVYVYGDDIIVPTKEVDTVINGLESAGLLVNKNKTFVQSHFRESCGIDAFGGNIVTPIYIRTTPPKTKRDAAGVAATVSSANQFYLKGYWKTSAILRAIVEQVMGTELPHVRPDSALLGWYSVSGHYSVMRWNNEHQCFQTHGFSVRIKKKADRLTGYRAMAKCFGENLSRTCVESPVLPEHLIDDPDWSLSTSIESPFGYGAHSFSLDRPWNGFLDRQDPLDEERFAVTSRRGAVYTKLRWVNA